jgi:hypothetical protein
LSFINRNPGAAAVAAALLCKRHMHESGISAEPSKIHSNHSRGFDCMNRPRIPQNRSLHQKQTISLSLTLNLSHSLSLSLTHTCIHTHTQRESSALQRHTWCTNKVLMSLEQMCLLLHRGEWNSEEPSRSYASRSPFESLAQPGCQSTDVFLCACVCRARAR